MGAKVFRDYAEANEELLKGYAVADVGIGINAEGSGMMIELERTIDNVVLGIDIIYDSTDEDGVPFRISSEYVKHIN